jgi:hypothetical protein
MVIQVIVGAVLVLLGVVAIVGLPIFIVNLEQRPIRERARMAQEQILEELNSVRRESPRTAEDEIREQLASMPLIDVEAKSENPDSKPHLISG